MLLQQEKDFVWAYITSEQIVICLSEIYKRKAKDSEMAATPLFLGNT